MSSFGVLTTTMSVSDSRKIVVSKEPTTRLHRFGLQYIEGKYLFIYVPYGYLYPSIKNIILVNTVNQTFNVIRILESSAYVLAEFDDEVKAKSYLEKIKIPDAQDIKDNSGVRVGFTVFE